ncbi:MAG: Ldh family oxidoreductase [Pseudomonadota bacterium]
MAESPAERRSLADCRALVARIFESHNTAPHNAASVARALVAAEADGQGGHGLSRVASYAAQAAAGKVDGHAVPTAEQDGAVLRVDAAHGFAYPAVDVALSALPAMVNTSGLAAAAIGRSHHCGVLGHTVEALAEQGLVAVMVSNTPAAMAPWGGARAIFGTNPIAFAAPGDDAPVVIDLSLSKTARGKIVRAAAEDEPIPEGWALDAEGRATTDAKAGLAGTMVPMGDAKGVALALMVEVLSAGLTGANYGFQASSFLDAEGEPPSVGQLLIAMDPARMGGSAAHIGTLLAAIDAEEGARRPGARRLLARAAAAREGLAIPDALMKLPGAA